MKLVDRIIEQTPTLLSTRGALVTHYKELKMHVVRNYSEYNGAITFSGDPVSYYGLESILDCAEVGIMLNFLDAHLPVWVIVTFCTSIGYDNVDSLAQVYTMTGLPIVSLLKDFLL